jgi:hypothetical protein
MVGSYSYSDHYKYINLILDGKIKDKYKSFYEFDRWATRSVRRVSEKFIELGWDEDYIEKKFRRLRDEHLESHQDDDTIYYFTYAWIYNTKAKGIYEILRVAGITDAKARELQEKLESLRDSVFTDRQLILMKLKVILKDQYYRVLSKRGEDISAIKDLVCEKGYKFYYLPTTYAHCKEPDSHFSENRLRIKGSDFTDQKTMYLYDNLDFAINVCRKMGQLTTAAIRVYQLPIVTPKIKYLEVDEWYTIVCNSRRFKMNIYDYKDEYKYHFIHGRICANPQEVYDRAEPIPRLDAGYQLAVMHGYAINVLCKSCIGTYVCYEDAPSNPV